MNQTRRFTLAFGLTADPPHRGHQQVVRNSFTWAEAHSLAVERLVLIPTYQPNLIADKQQPRTAYQHRQAMCEILATEVRQDLNKTVEVSDIEKKLFNETGEKSYSFDTLNALQTEYPDTTILFVLSADHFAGRWPKFRKWHQWQSLVKHHGLMIHQRPSHRINQSFVQTLKQLNSNVYVLSDQPVVDVSSTQLRQKLANSSSINTTLLSNKVFNYANSQELYRKM